MGTLVVSLAFCLTGCGTGSPTTKPSHTSTTVGAASGAPAVSSRPAATLLAAGFGQQGEFVWATSLVRNDGTHTGQTVTVNFNLLDKRGTLVASGSQVEGFSRAGQKLVLGTQIQVPTGVTVASVEASVNVDDSGTFSGMSHVDLGTYPMKISVGDFGSGWSASFALKNPTNQPLRSPRIGIICTNARGKVIGGDSEFPELVPASGQILVKTNNLITNGKPSACTAYVGPSLG